MTSDVQGVAGTLIELADTLVSDFDLLDYLDLLLDRTGSALDATAGGVLLADGQGRLQLLAATDEHVRTTELFELQRGEGPCIESYAHGVAVVEPDLTACERWPAFTRAALDAGYRAAFSFPMRLRDTHIGALNVFRSAPGGVDSEMLAAARAFAHMAAIGILQERAVREARDVTTQLQRALDSRIVLEQAKGVVAERLGCEMGEAYQLLRWHARDHNRTLRSVAAAVVVGELPADALLPPEGRRG